MGRVKKHGIQKLNNKGLSLIEILVAMLILSTVSIVFLQSFVYSVNMNEGAKENQEILTFEQSLMEGVKAYDIATLDTQFDEGLTPNVGDFKLFSITDSGVTRTCTQNGEGRVYTINNVPFDSANYSATITMTPCTTYKAPMVEVEQVNAYNDAFVRTEQDEQADFKDQLEETLENVYGYTGGMSSVNVTVKEREIVVNVAADDTVTYKSVYDSKVKFMLQDAVTGAITPHQVDVTVTLDYCSAGPAYSNANTQTNGATLEKLYIYYYPAYTDTVNDLYKVEADTITINSEAANLRDIYIYKQVNESYILLGSDSKLVQAETNYDLDVSCTTTSVPDIYHNLDERLTGTESSSVTFSGSGYNEKGNSWDEETTDTILLYDVKVEITNSGTGEKVGEIIGSTNLR